MLLGYTVFCVARWTELDALHILETHVVRNSDSKSTQGICNYRLSM